MLFAVTVTFVVKEQYLDDFKQVMKAQATNSLNREPGCHQFDVCFDPSDARRVFLYELYTDKAAFEDHLKTDHFLNFDSTVKDWLISKTAENWQQWSSSRG
ncbi:MAG: putative quinol monooxygenase [Desulfuromonadales bacterium]|nr:putative quinol monooxygenase [Desulfuromonadales bacterium]